MLTEIRIPRPPAKARQTFLKLTLRKPIDFAVVSVASVITVSDGLCQDAKIALGAVAPTPIRATVPSRQSSASTLTPKPPPLQPKPPSLAPARLAKTNTKSTKPEPWYKGPC